MCSWYFYVFLLITVFILFPWWTSWFSSPSMLLFWKSLLLLLDCSASLRSTLVFSGWQFPKLQSRAVNIYMSRFMIYFAFKIYLILTLARFVFENQNYVVSIRLRLNKKKDESWSLCKGEFDIMNFDLTFTHIIYIKLCNIGMFCVVNAIIIMTRSILSPLKEINISCLIHFSMCTIISCFISKRLLLTYF